MGPPVRPFRPEEVVLNQVLTRCASSELPAKLPTHDARSTREAIHSTFDRIQCETRIRYVSPEPMSGIVAFSKDQLKLRAYRVPRHFTSLCKTKVNTNCSHLETLAADMPYSLMYRRKQFC